VSKLQFFVCRLLFSVPVKTPFTVTLVVPNMVPGMAWKACGNQAAGNDGRAFSHATASTMVLR
jgi:hypothetical protein